MKKKLVTILLALCLAGTAGACGSTQNTSEASDNENSSLQKIESTLSEKFEDVDVADSQTSEGTILYVTASESTDSYDLGEALGQIINESWFDYDNILMSQYVNGQFCVSNLIRSSDHQMGSHVWLDSDGNIIGSATDSDSTITETAEAPEKSTVTFENDTLTAGEATIRITNTEVITGEYDYCPYLLVFSYDFTNNSEELLVPEDIWDEYFSLTQETDTTVDQLQNIGTLPRDSKYSEPESLRFTDIKAGATVQVVKTYAIEELSYPVALTISDNYGENVLGTKVINLQ